ncbi:MAG TPA: hypothetical protein DDZ51_18020 [Planctomycetaceae bacterium]|nr:hypothetical protein [Planctomycetaceae bacterium]
MKTTIIKSLVTLCFLPFAASCSGTGDDNRPSRVKTSGTVTHNGQLVENATVLFSPADGKGYAATGLTDAKGRFQLTTFQARDGAVPGRYQVTISKFDMSTANPDLEDDLAIEMRQDSDKIVGPTPLLPVQYAEIDTTPLAEEVTAGNPNEFSFEL